jgi:hypothetical protein
MISCKFQNYMKGGTQLILEEGKTYSTSELQKFLEVGSSTWNHKRD